MSIFKRYKGEPLKERFQKKVTKVVKGKVKESWVWCEREITKQNILKYPAFSSF